MFYWRRVALAAVAAVFLTACGRPRTVSVVYAGSLVHVMEQSVAPAFDAARHLHFAGQAGGSVQLAHELAAGLLQADVFVSADPRVNALLATGPARVNWYLGVFTNELVLAYDPQSPLAPAFAAAAAGRGPWYVPLLQPGLRLGRTDPLLDPKGYDTLIAFQLAERVTGQADLAARVLGPAENPAQIFPEEQLVARLQAGQLDAAILYHSEAMDGHLPFVSLPARVNLGDPALSAWYATARVTVGQKTWQGAPILYTMTIPANAPDPAGGEAWIEYVVAGPGAALLHNAGLTPVPVTVGGDRAAVPAALAQALNLPASGPP